MRLQFRSLCSYFFAITLFMTSLSMPVTVLSQEAPHAKDKAVQKIIKMFHIEHASTDQMMSVIQTILEDKVDLRLSADIRLNSIIAQGTPETLKEVEEVIRALDQPPPSKIGPHVRVIDTNSFPAVWNEEGKLIHSLANMFGLSTAGQKDLGKIMVMGEDEQIESFEKILSSLQSSEKERTATTSEKMIQVLWLATKGPSDNWSEPEANLRPVIEKLAAMGFDNIGVAGQVLTRFTFGSDSSPFRADGTNAKGQRFRIQGKLEPGSGTTTNHRANIDFQIDGLGQDKKGAALSVVVQLVEGKPIILGSAPLDGLQSFFVIQLLND